MSANAGEIRARLVLSNSEFKQKMNEAREDMKRTGFSAEQMNKDFSLIQKGAGIMGAAIVAAVGASVKAAANLEQNMANIRSVTGATDEELKRLEKTAREWAAQTKYDADQTSSALFELSKAGFSVNEQIEALPAVLSAATAGNIDLADSASIVANTMRAFKIPAEEVTTAVDILAKTANSANTDIPGIAEGLKYVAPVAQSLGWTLEETAASLGTLANYGIDASQAGTVLRASLLALANPTGQTAKAMKELNIEVLDADGNMKELPDLIGHIASKMEGMTDAQKTQTAAQLVGTQAASGFLALLDEGETSLANYVTELENSAGAAEEMAKIQADTLNGAFEEFKSVLAEAGIQLGQEFLPEFRRIVDYGSDVVRTMSEVDMGTVKAGIAFAGTASAIAFTASTIGKLALAIGPLLASMGPAGWLIIGASVLGGAIAALNVKMKESRKVNLELQESLTEQADALESNVEEFDKLRGKSKATNDEFARMIDIQEELSQTQDPRRVEALQKEYEELQKKSGLSNDETVKMIDLNNDIINQSPNVEQSFTDRGNSVVGATDAVKEYVQSLREMAFEELKIQQDAAFEERQRLLEENRDTTDEIAWINSNLNTIYENQDMSLGEIENRLEEINRKMNQGMLTTEEYIELEQEQSALLAIQNGLHGEALKKAQERKEELQGIIDSNNIELQQLDAVDQRILEIYLKEVDINYEKGKGIQKLDETISKLQKERDELVKNTSEEDKQNKKYQEKLNKLDESIQKHEGVRVKIQDEIKQQENSNKELEKSISLSKNRGSEVDNINSKISDGTQRAKAQNDELSKPISKEVTIWERVKQIFSREPKTKYHTGGIITSNATPITNSTEQSRASAVKAIQEIKKLYDEVV